MFKRFHDRDKWHKQWYAKLPPKEKCAWDFITSECDNVGVWEADFEAAEYFIGEKINWDSFRNKCNGNIFLMPNGKWWLVDFCRFQYPELSESTNSKPLLSYIALLKKHTLWIPYCNGINTVQDKEEEKEKEEEEDKGLTKAEISTKHKLGTFGNVLLTEQEQGRLISELGESFFCRAIDFYSAWKKEKGKKSKDDNLTIRRWVIDAVKKQAPPVSEPIVAEQIKQQLPICPVCGTTGTAMRESSCPKCRFVLEPKCMNDPELVAEWVEVWREAQLARA